jgi:hypothetical protein
VSAKERGKAIQPASLSAAYSWLLPTSMSVPPTRHTSSVADGSRDTTFILTALCDWCLGLTQLNLT